MITQKISKVKGISEKRRLPRLGKIRLGVKVINQKTNKEYPKEVDYFIVPQEVSKVYGEKPKELDILIPINDLSVVFPQAYKWYGESKGLKCIGDGAKAYRINEKNVFIERECPCEMLNKGCSLKAHLLVILPKVNMGGVYQIDVGSYHSIVNINSGLEYVELLIGRFAMVPLKLRRVPKDIPYEGRLTTHYPLQVIFEGDINLVNQLRENNKRILLVTKNIALPQIEDEKQKFSVSAQCSQIASEKPNLETHPETQKDIKPPTEAQLKTIKNILLRNNYEEEIIESVINEIKDIKEASELITKLMKKDFTFVDEIANAIELPEEDVDFEAIE